MAVNTDPGKLLRYGKQPNGLQHFTVIKVTRESSRSTPCRTHCSSPAWVQKTVTCGQMTLFLREGYKYKPNYSCLRHATLQRRTVLIVKGLIFLHFCRMLSVSVEGGWETLMSLCICEEERGGRSDVNKEIRENFPVRMFVYATQN